ncbi:unnamed protein product, partial [Polarella glacialis]
VGTTCFDALIQAVDTQSFHAQALKLGYDRMVIQVGKGSYRPGLGGNALGVECFDFKPSLEEEMNSASLVISHAGAGSVIEALRAGRRLLVVVNPLLMDNHQLELAEAMHSRGFCAMARRPEDLLEALEEAATMQPKSYPPIDLGPWHKVVEDACGVAPAND